MRLELSLMPKEQHLASVDLFNTLKWVPFYAESYVNRCALTYKGLNGNIPKYINDLLIRNSDTHNRSTRFCNINLMWPRFKRSTEGGRAFAVRATKEWNKLNTPSLTEFEGRTVSYRPSFFLLDLWPKREARGP